MSPVAVALSVLAVDAARGGEVPGQSGVFQRRPEGRLGALAGQQETRLQTPPHRHGRQKHQPLREGTRAAVEAALRPESAARASDFTSLREVVTASWCVSQFGLVTIDPNTFTL